MPEPSDSYEVSIGDIGRLYEGQFCPLFNSMHDATDEANARRRVPINYRKFNEGNVIVQENDKITQHMVCSRSISAVEAQGDVSGGGGVALPISTGVGFNFRSTSDGGALILLVPPARSKDIHSNRHIVNYMKDNFESWMELADSWGLDLKGHELMFVCGTTKTTQWGVAAFQGGRYREKDGHVSSSLGSVATAQFSIRISNESLPTTHYRHGPNRERNTPTIPMIQSPGHDRPDASSPKRDQCIFVHYFKMKRRLWIFKEPIRARAGPHELPPGGPDDPETDAARADAGSPTYEFEPERFPKQEQTYDPVDDLLDYILQESEANIAIACDLDIIAIFQNEDFPQDIPAALLKAAPQIEVDEYGVGTVSVSYSFEKRRAGGEEVGEDVAESTRTLTERLDEYSIDPTSDAQSTMDTGFNAGHGIDRLSTDDAAESPRDKAVGKRQEYGGPLSVHDGTVSSLTYSIDGRYVASGSQDGSIIIWDARENVFLRKLPIHPDLGHHEIVSALAFSRDNQLLASASPGEDITLWSVANGRLHKRIHTDGASIHSLVYTPDRLHLVAGASDGKLYVWNTDTYEQRGTLEKNTAVVTFIIFSPNERYMATGGMESTCFVWDTANLASCEPMSTLNNEDWTVYSVAFAPDNRRIITASDDGSSCIWNAETGEKLVNLHEHSDPVWTVAFSPDGKHVASGSSDSTVKVCDSFDGRRLLSLDEHDGTINVVQFSPNGKYIATAASDNMVHLWDTSDGSLVRKYNEHNDEVTSMMFSPDGTTLASGSRDGTVHIRPLIIQQ